MKAEFTASIQAGGTNTLRIAIPRALCRQYALHKKQLVKVQIELIEDNIKKDKPPEELKQEIPID